MSFDTQTTFTAFETETEQSPALPALVTISQQSLLDAWSLGFAGGAGVGINLGGIGLSGGVPSLRFRILWAIGLGLATAIISGTAGYVLGVRLRRFMTSDE